MIIFANQCVNCDDHLKSVATAMCIVFAIDVFVSVVYMAASHMEMETAKSVAFYAYIVVLG